MARQGWGEYITHYDNDSYRHYIPCWVDLDEMSATFPDEDNGEYWEPEAPLDLPDWNDSWEEVEFEDVLYPAVKEGDGDGRIHMSDSYGENGFVTVFIPE